MNNANSEIKLAAKKAGVYLYNIADCLGISENTMTRLLRRELPEEKKTEIKGIIAKLAAEQHTDTNVK